MTATERQARSAELKAARELPQGGRGLGAGGRARTGCAIAALVALVAGLGIAENVRSNVTERPLPPEYRFASDSLFPAMKDPSRALWILARLKPILAKYPRHAPFRQIKFWALANSGAPVPVLTALTDSLIGGLQVGGADPPGRFQQVQHCLDLADVLTARRESLTVAESYARMAIGIAALEANHPVLGANASRQLAEVQFAEGKADSAILNLRVTMSRLPEDQTGMHVELRDVLARCLHATGRDDEAIAVLFESVSMDQADSLAAATVLRRLWRNRFGEDGDLGFRIRRAREAWRMFSGMALPNPGRWPAPPWSLRDMAGKEVVSTALLGKPYVLVFWGSWSERNREVARLAETWFRRQEEIGVRVVGCDWELPGPGPISRGAVRAFIRQSGYRFPVALDEDQRVFRAFKARCYPQVFFVDGEGFVRGTGIGFVPGWSDSLTHRVSALGSQFK